MRTARFVLAAAVIALSAQSAGAQDVGVPACDEFLNKYNACIGAKVPEAQRETMSKALSAVRANWTAVAQTADGKTQLAGVCKQTADQLKAQVAALNCAW